MATTDKVVNALSDLRGAMNKELDAWAEQVALLLSRYDIFRSEALHRTVGVLLQYIERTVGKTPASKALSELFVDFGERVFDNFTGKYSVFSTEQRGDVRKKRVASLKEEFLAAMLRRLEKSTDPDKELQLLREGFAEWEKILKSVFPELEKPEGPVVPPAPAVPKKSAEEVLNDAAAGLKKFREKNLKRTRRPRRSLWTRIRERFSNSDDERARRFREALEKEISGGG